MANLQIPLSEGEKDAIKRAARAAHLPLATWARSQLLKLAEKTEGDK